MSKTKDQRNEIRDMTTETALHELAVARRKMFDLRMQSARGEVKDVRQFADTRKRVARLLHKLHMAALYPEETEFLEAPDDEVDEIAAPAAAETEEK